MVESTPRFWIDLRIAGGQITQEFHRSLQALIRPAEVGLSLRQLPLYGDKGSLQLGLLGLKHVERNCLRVCQPVGYQAPAPGFDLLNLALASGGVLPLVLGEQAELLDQLRLDGGSAVSQLGYLLAVVASDFLLKPIGREIWQIASRAPMPTTAHEVVVLATVAGDLREQQPLAAEFTEDRSLDVVLVSPGAIAALRAAIEDLLDAIE